MEFGSSPEEDIILDSDIPAGVFPDASLNGEMAGGAMGLGQDKNGKQK